MLHICLLSLTEKKKKRYLSIKRTDFSDSTHRTGTNTFGSTGGGTVFHNTLLVGGTMEFRITLHFPSVWTDAASVTGLSWIEQLWRNISSAWADKTEAVVVTVQVWYIINATVPVHVESTVLYIDSHTLPQVHTYHDSTRIHRHTHILLCRGCSGYSPQGGWDHCTSAGRGGHTARNDCSLHKVELEERQRVLRWHTPIWSCSCEICQRSSLKYNLLKCTKIILKSKCPTSRSRYTCSYIDELPWFWNVVAGSIKSFWHAHAWDQSWCVKTLTTLRACLGPQKADSFGPGREWIIPWIKGLNAC